MIALYMLTGAFLYAAGLATAVFYLRRRRTSEQTPAPPPAVVDKAKGYEQYRDPLTGLLSCKHVKAS